jgi:predicted small metal-binding protein
MMVGPQSWTLVDGVDAKVMPTFCQQRRRTNNEEEAMARIIRCECGFVARGETDDEVIDAIRTHMRADHPTLLETVGQEDLLGWIQLE